MGRYAKNRELKSGSYSIRMPIGSVAIGPEAPVDGLMRYNTSRKRPEVYFENKWRSMLGNEIYVPAKDTFYGDGTAVTFGPMKYPYPNGNELFVLVFIHNVFQNPNNAYTVENYTITFTSPPPLNHPIIVLHGLTNGDAFTALPPPPPTPPPPPVPTPVPVPVPVPSGPIPVPVPTPPVGATLNNFVNGTFESTTPTSQFGTEISIPGWKIYLESTRINAARSISGCPTVSTNLSNYAFDDSVPATVAYNGNIVTEAAPGDPGSRALLLFSIGTITQSQGVARGPYLVSDNYVNIASGDTLELYWKVENKPLAFYVTENYDVVMYLVSKSCNTLMLLHEFGSTKTWTKLSRTFTATEAGEYRLVIVSGSSDRSGGGAVGTQLYLDNIKLIKNVVLS